MAKSQALLNVLNLVDAAKEELPVEVQFLNDLKASIELQDRKQIRKPSTTYKPSSLHCIRNMFYQVTGAEQASDRASSELVGICESGTDRHEHIQKAVMAMKENGIDCEYVDVGDFVSLAHCEGRLIDIEVISKQGNETKLFNKKLNMSFLCDGIIGNNTLTQRSDCHDISRCPSKHQSGILTDGLNLIGISIKSYNRGLL